MFLFCVRNAFPDFLADEQMLYSQSSVIRSTVDAGRALLQAARGRTRNPPHAGNAVQAAEHVRVNHEVQEEEHLVLPEAPPEYQEVQPEPVYYPSPVLVRPC